MSREYTRIYTSLGLVPISGKVIMHDSFPDPLLWTPGGTGGDVIFELDPSLFLTLPSSLRCKTRTTGAAGGDTISATRQIYLLPSKKVQIIGRFNIIDETRLKYLIFECIWYDGTDLHQAHIRYANNVPKVEYFDNAGIHQDALTPVSPLHDSAWHIISFTLDFSNNVYLEGHFNSTPLGIDNVPFYTFTDGTPAHLAILVSATALADTPVDIRFDEFLIMEP